MTNANSTPDSILPAPTGATGPAASRTALPGEQVFDFTTNTWIKPQPTAQPNPFQDTGSLSGTMTTPSTPTTTPTTPPKTAGTVSTQATDVQPANLATPTTPVQSATPSPLNMSQFASYLDTMKQKLKDQNDLASQRNLLYTALFNRPLSQEEISQLSPAQQTALQNGDKNAVEMSLRILNDTISGRTNTLNQSVDYLTNAYQSDLTRADSQKQQAIQTITSLFNQYKDNPSQAADILKSLYTPDQIAALKAQGVDIDALSNQIGGNTNLGNPIGNYLGMPTYDTEGTNPGLVRATRNNNPGNIKASAATIKYPGVIGVESKPAADGGYFLIFDSASSGANAQATLLVNGSAYQGKTAEQAIRAYSGGGYGAAAVGLDPNQDFQSQISDPTVLQNVVKAIQKNEGYQPLATSSVPGGGQYTPIDVTQVQDKNVGNPEWGGLSYNGLLNDAKLFLANEGKMPSLGLGSAKDTQAKRNAIQNYAGQLADQLGMDVTQISALYKANSKAVSSIIDRVAKIEATSSALASQFPRLADLAGKVGNLGIQESDVTAGKAKAAQKFGSVDAANYIELINTVRGDYSAMQAALAGSRGAELFSQSAAEAIPLGLTPEQYQGLMETIQQSAAVALNATSETATNILNGIGNSPAGATAPSTGNDYDAYLKAIGQ